MDKNKKKILVSFENEILKEIENYRFKNRFENRNCTIIHLIKIGLNADKKGK